MAQTRLQYLTTRNTHLEILTSSPSTYTQHHDWAPVEEIQGWDDFNHPILTKRYRDSLARKIDPFDSVPASEEAGHNLIVDEAGLTILLGATNITKVSRALPKSLFLAAGSRVIAMPGVRPDWGAGDTGRQYSHPKGICQALVCGDTKLNWDVHRAMQLVNEGDYEEHPDAHLVRPFEQIQHYCTVYQTRYGFILTNEYNVNVRVRLSLPISGQRASGRTRQMKSEGHRRILSDTSTKTDISDTFSAMSFKPKPQDEDVAVLEVAIVPWKHEKLQELSVNLSLYCLVLLADEERELSHDYGSLDKTENRNKGQTQETLRKRKAEDQELTKSSISKSKSEQQTYWFPKEEIAWEVITTDIQIYMPGASVRQEEYNGKSGYHVTSRLPKTSREELQQMLSDLKADTQNWKKEGGEYEKSQVRKSRHHWKGTWATRQ